MGVSKFLTETPNLQKQEQKKIWGGAGGSGKVSECFWQIDKESKSAKNGGGGGGKGRCGRGRG